MSCLVDNSVLFDETNLATNKSVILDLSQTDRLSIQITVVSFTSTVLTPTVTLLESVDGINFTPISQLYFATQGVTIWHVDPIFSQFQKIWYRANGEESTFKIQINAHNDTITSFGGTITKVFGVS